MIPVDRSKIVHEARTWLGTPWRHGAREKGLGVDCVGLLIGVARDLGLSGGYDNRNYDRVVNPDVLLAEMLKFLRPLSSGEEWEPGDVLVMSVRGVAQHVAIWTGGGIVHAAQDVGRVVEHRLAGPMRQTVALALRWRGEEIAGNG